MNAYKVSEKLYNTVKTCSTGGIIWQLTSACSIFTFEIKGGAEEAKKFIDNLQVFSLLANVADVKSLVIHPASTTHSQLSEEELLDQGIKPNTIRLSIGTEHIDDIIDDLEEAFAAVR